MGKTPLRKVSEKQAQKLRLWNKITIERIRHLIEKYGVPICEYCGKAGCVPANESPFYLRGHHIDRNRNNNTLENCYVCHNGCHQYITDHNFTVCQEGFEGRNNKGG